MQHATLQLHEEYFLLAHDGYTGRAHIKTRVLGTGLAGALLSGLLLAGCLDLVSGVVRVRDEAPAQDMVTRAAVTAIQQRARPVAWWVECLRQSVYPLTAERLTRQGVVSPLSAGLLRTGTRYVANDALLAAGPRVRLRYAAETRAVPPDPRTVTLAALALATGLEGVVADAANRLVRDSVRALAAVLPPDLQPLLAGVDAAVTRLALATPRGL
jgi:hypothetical protein